MVRLVFVAQTLQNVNCLLLGRLADGNGLESALKGGVLLDMTAVFVERCGADDLDLAPCERGLQDICGIDRTLRRACADERVNFIYEEYHIARLLDFFDSVADALLKVAPVFGAGDHACEVERNYPLISQQLGHLARGYLERQPLGYGRLADTGLADETGVILRPPAEDLNDPLYLLLPADDGVYPALICKGGQIPAKL